MLGRERLALLPAFGAGTFGSLASLSVGWNLNMLFILDGDNEGKKKQKQYLRDYCLDENRVITINQLVDGVKVIENLLDDNARKIISSKLEIENKMPSKRQIAQYFQEFLARNEIHYLSSVFENNVKRLFDELEKRISQTSNAPGSWEI